MILYLHSHYQSSVCNGEMAERSNAAVLKTVDCYRSGGSNPSFSAESPSLRGFLHFNNFTFYTKSYIFQRLREFNEDNLFYDIYII